MVCNTIPGTSSTSAAPPALILNFNAFPGLTAWATVVTRLRRWHQALPDVEEWHSMPHLRRSWSTAGTSSKAGESSLAGGERGSRVIW